MIVPLRSSLLYILCLIGGVLGGLRLSRLLKQTLPPPTVDNLLGRGLISEQEVWLAVDAYIADPNVGPHRFSSGHVLDVAAVATAPEAIRAILADPNLVASLRREIVRTMVILATPKAGCAGPGSGVAAVSLNRHVPKEGAHRD